MKAPRRIGFVLAWGAALLLATASLKAPGQVTHDPEDAVYATGVIFETAEELADKLRTPLYRNYLPPSVDLSDRFPRAGDQGDQGSCVGWAVGYAARSYYNSAPGGGRWLREDQIPSPAYIYDALRGPDDTSCRSGTRISDALDLLGQGVASLADYAYQESLCRPPGAPSAVPDGGRFRIARWLVVDVRRLDQVKAELAGGHPVVIGMRTDRRFDKLRGRKIWWSGAPRDGDGRHAVTVVGYSESGQYFLVMNSWGEGWGDRGFGRISYETFRRRVKVGYSMRLVEKPPPVPPSPPPAPELPPPKPDIVSPEPDPSPPAPVVPALKLPVVGCGNLAVEERGDQSFVVGFVGNREDLAKVTQTAEKSNVQSQVELRPWPQCEALMTLEKPLAQADRPSIALPKAVYRVGETLAFDVSMADFQGYVHVAYVQADGSVVNLAQSDSRTLSTLAAGSEMRFGDGREGRPRFTVSAPFGDEMIVVVASKSPLFAEDRPLVETEREFLTTLRKAIIARPDPALPERVVTASFVALETIEGE